MESADREHESAAMKITTLRFGRDLWRVLESEAALAGTSVSQYIREAALARAAAAATARGQSVFDLLGMAASTAPTTSAGETGRATAARTRAAATRRSAEALHAQSRQAWQEASKRTQRAAKLASRSKRDGGSE